MMRITLVCSLLIYQLLQHCDATVQCRPLTVFRDESIEAASATISSVDPGSTKEIYSRENSCNHPGNNSYILLHQNHHTEELDNILQQESFKFTLSNIQLDTSGIYCMYKQCAPQEKDQCCIRIIVSPEVEIIFTTVVHNNVQQLGVCSVKAWPPSDMDVFTDNTCAITKQSLSYTDFYTTARFFTLERNSNSSCLSVSCQAQFGIIKTKNFRINPTISTPTSTSVRHPNPSTTGPIISPTSNATSFESSAAPTPSITPECICSSDSGVLGIYRITLWIIVLTLTLLSTAITSLTPGLL